MMGVAAARGSRRVRACERFACERSARL